MGQTILSPQEEILADYSDMMHALEDNKEKCIKANQPVLAEKWQGIIEAFNAFTQEEIIAMDTILN